MRDFGASSHDLSALLSLPTTQTKPHQTPKVEPSTFPAGSEILAPSSPERPHRSDFSKRFNDGPTSGVISGKEQKLTPAVNFAGGDAASSEAGLYGSEVGGSEAGSSTCGTAVGKSEP